MIGFASFKNRTIIEGKVNLLTALHIGRGQSLEPVGTDQPVVKDLVGKPFIPGSSFKGILRSTAERLTATLYRGASNIIEPCFITDEKGKCISCEEEFKVEKDNLERFKNRKPDPPTTKEIAEWFWDKLCPVCRLFGSPHFSSKIAIKDLTVDEKTWFAHFEIRDGVAIDRGTETASKGKLYNFEAVPAGVEFDLNIVLDNADEKDLGLLYLALEDFRRGNAFIGGSKTKGLGNVELRYTKIEEIDEDNLVNHLLYGKGRTYKSEDEEPAETEYAESEDIEEQEKETAKEPAPSFPQLEMPEAINTPEDAYKILYIALAELSKSEQKYGSEQDYNTAIWNKLAELGLGRQKRKELGLDEKLGDFLNKADDNGRITKLDDGRYIPTNPSEEKENENDVDDESEPDSQPSEIESDDVELTLDDYHFKCKIKAFVKYITQKPTKKQEM